MEQQQYIHTPESLKSGPSETRQRHTLSLMDAVVPAVTRHNGLLTPFCRRQISFMRNYKHNRKGPL
jgi:hypothetical protein